MRNLIFFVTDESWEEHNRVGIAAINDPMVQENPGKNANALRQVAIAEIAGIRPGDRIFFKRGVTDRHPTQVLGVYKATSVPYFDPNPLFPGAIAVGRNRALRVEFECVKNYPNPINVEHLWLSKERGSLWTIQQGRGDVIGRHACVSITTEEADFIVRLLEANNPIIAAPIYYQPQRAAVGLVEIDKRPLPIDLTEDSPARPFYFDGSIFVQCPCSTTGPRYRPPSPISNVCRITSSGGSTFRGRLMSKRLQLLLSRR